MRGRNSRIENLIFVCARQKHKKQWMIVIEPVVVIAGDRYRVPEDPAGLCKIMNASESIGLIEDMLGRADIRHQVECVKILAGHFEAVQVCLNDTFPWVEIDAFVAVARVSKQFGNLP